MNRRRRKAGAVNGVEKGAQILQVSKSSEHKPSHTNEHNKPQQITERESMLQMWMELEQWCIGAKEELTRVKRFLSVLGLISMYDDFVKQSTIDDEMAYCKKGVSAIESKVALKR